MKKILAFLQLMRFDKPIGIFLLMWPTLWALWIAAQGRPQLKLVVVFILGVVLMRAAGCVMNDIADRHIDVHVKRTRSRPLATQKVTVKESLVLLAILCLMAFVLVLQLNSAAIQLSFIGLILAVIYPFLKRITHLPQLGLGIAFSWGIPMAFAAQCNEVPWVAWWLFAAAALWTVAYDTQYAMVDRQDDQKIGIRSTALLFGYYDRIIIALLQISVLLTLAFIAYWVNLGIAFYIGWILGTCCFIYQQFLIHERDENKCFQAFLNNHWFGLIVFFGIYLSYDKNFSI